MCRWKYNNSKNSLSNVRCIFRISNNTFYNSIWAYWITYCKIIIKYIQNYPEIWVNVVWIRINCGMSWCISCKYYSYNIYIILRIAFNVTKFNKNGWRTKTSCCSCCSKSYCDSYTIYLWWSLWYYVIKVHWCNIFGFSKLRRMLI